MSIPSLRILALILLASLAAQSPAAAPPLQPTPPRAAVLRARASHDGPLPEDASWAVLPAARTSSVAVTSEATGFHTGGLRVPVSPHPRLTVADLEGHILQQDTRGVEWHGKGFHVYKQKFVDSHFFGLGDKPGPLDR